MSGAKVFVLIGRERQFHSICKFGFNKLDIPMFEELVKITKYRNEKIVLVSTEHRSDLQVVMHLGRQKIMSLLKHIFI